MDDICYVDGCPGTADFSCSCNDRLRVCQEHITEHSRSHGYHKISASSVNRTFQLAGDAMKALNEQSAKAILKGKEMFTDLFDQIGGIFEDLNERKQSVISLSASSYSEEIGRKIKKLEEVNINFREKSDFKDLLKKFMSPGGVDSIDNSTILELQKDFRLIAESLNRSNELLQTVTGTHKIEQDLRKHLESRVDILEQGALSLIILIKNCNFLILKQRTKRPK